MNRPEFISSSVAHSPMAYRPDIDGLRSIAVMVVVLFHAGFDTLSGGFIGVDVFFVISGFLITKLLVTEYEATGRVDFAQFYLRRVRRLFPALFTVLAVSMIPAFLMFTSEDMEETAASAIFSIYSLSNVFFWATSDYFDAGAKLKPFLHTWSLSVEEQFYLFWPVLLLILMKMGRRVAPFVLLLLMIGSLVIAEYWLRSDSPGWFGLDMNQAAFYLLPARVSELGLGAILVWGQRFRPSNNAVNEILLLLGLGLIVWSAFTFNSEMSFPGLSALVPCTGAALAIMSGTARYSGFLLRNRLAVFLGLISYSIYLVHWPLLVYYQSYTYRSLTTPESYALVALSILCGWLLYRYVEQRFRRQRPQGSWTPAGFAFGASFLAILFILPAAGAWASDGWKWRIPESPSRKG